MKSKEQWRPVIGFENLYLISDQGNVKSLDRVDSLNRIWLGRTLKKQNSGNGYHQVRLSRDGQTYSKRIHVMVAESFLNHQPDGYSLVVDHINGDKLDNRLENLQVITHRSNTAKGFKNKTSKHTGVCRVKPDKWRASIQLNGVNKILGNFRCETKAHLEYLKALKTAGLLILVLLISSCTPQKRLNNLLNKHPYLGKTKDSIIFDTTRIITKDVRFDTLTSIEGIRRDTLVIHRDNLLVKTIVHKDSIYVFGNCKSDTIEVTKEIKVPVQMFTYEKKTFWSRFGNKFFWLLLIAGILTALFFILRLFR
jgi:hypothetical protein